MVLLCACFRIHFIIVEKWSLCPDTKHEPLYKPHGREQPEYSPEFEKSRCAIVKGERVGSGDSGSREKQFVASGRAPPLKHTCASSVPP